MSLSAPAGGGAVLPLGAFLRDNSRALCAVAVCVIAQAYAAGNARDPVWSPVLGSDSCEGLTNGDGYWICSDMTGAAPAGEQLNFSAGRDESGHIGIEGGTAAATLIGSGGDILRAM